MVHHKVFVNVGGEKVSFFGDEYEEWSPPSPASDSKIWRYRCKDYYESILEEESLWFGRADCFDDPYEGSLPTSVVIEWKKKLKQRGGPRSDIFRQLRMMSHINCWHENTSESIAMWDLYLEEGVGVAIISTPKRLRNALQLSDEDYVTGSVDYIDYDDGGFNINTDLAPLFHKRESFQHEREYRILHREEINKGKISADEMEEEVPCTSPILVDVDELIEEVRISPRCDDEFLQEIEGITREQGYDFPVEESIIPGEPMF